MIIPGQNGRRAIGRARLGKMKKLVENFKHFLVEEKSIYIVEMLVKAEPATRLYGKIFESIRGLEGVTVIRSTEAIQRDQQNNKLMILSVRFYVNPANSIPYLEKLKNKIRTMTDAEGDRILSVQIRKMPQKQDDIFR